MSLSGRQAAIAAGIGAVLIAAAHWNLRDGIQPDTDWDVVTGTVERSSIHPGPPKSGAKVARITVAYVLDGQVRRKSGTVTLGHGEAPTAYRTGTSAPVYVLARPGKTRVMLQPPGRPEALWLAAGIFGSLCLLGACLLRRRQGSEAG